MTGTTAPVGTLAWVAATGGQLTAAERRRLLRPIADGPRGQRRRRVAMLIHVNSGRRAEIDLGSTGARRPRRWRPPPSTRPGRRLSPALLNHSYRTYAFGAALGALANIDVDRELLFAAAMLHDVGLTHPVDRVDFTLASARVARDVAETVGLSTAATETMRTAITLHHSPGVSLADGPVAYLLSAGAGVDVAGLQAWKLPPRVLAEVIAQQAPAGLQTRVRRGVPRRSRRRPARPGPPAAPLRRIRPCHQARPVPRLKQQQPRRASRRQRAVARPLRIAIPVI